MPVAGVTANLAQFVGEDKIYQDQILQADGVTPQDITNWQITFTMHAYGDPATVFFTKTVGSGISVPQPNNGICQITVAQADTINLNPGQYSYSIIRTNPNADAVPTYGLFTLLQA